MPLDCQVYIDKFTSLPLVKLTSGNLKPASEKEIQRGQINLHRQVYYQAITT